MDMQLGVTAFVGRYYTYPGHFMCSVKRYQNRLRRVLTALARPYHYLTSLYTANQNYLGMAYMLGEGKIFQAGWYFVTVFQPYYKYSSYTSLTGFHSSLLRL
jgi:hypothetical protein